MNVFTVVANTTETATEPNTFAVWTLVFIGTAIFLGWVYLANNAWENLSNKKTDDNRAELIIALLAPLTVPAMAIMAGAKWMIERTNRKASA